VSNFIEFEYADDEHDNALALINLDEIVSVHAFFGVLYLFIRLKGIPPGAPYCFSTVEQLNKAYRKIVSALIPDFSHSPAAQVLKNMSGTEIGMAFGKIRPPVLGE